jgi:hypothetical protein
MLKKLSIFTIAWSMLTPFCAISVDEKSDDLRLALQRPLLAYTISGDSFVQVLTRVASQFRIPMGIEWVKSPESLKPLSFTWHEATVEQVLSRIVSSQPGYSYDIENAVFHVLPPDALHDDLSFLNLRIKSFAVDNEFVEFAGFRLKAILRRILYPGTAKSKDSGSRIWREYGNWYG